MRTLPAAVSRLTLARKLITPCRSYTFTDADLQWFKRQPGVEEIKVETSPGDMILWDSRLVHWNRTPTGEQIRVVVYACYAPRSMASEAVLAKRRECWDKRRATTHWCASRACSRPSVPRLRGPA